MVLGPSLLLVNGLRRGRFEVSVDGEEARRFRFAGGLAGLCSGSGNMTAEATTLEIQSASLKSGRVKE